MNKVSTLFFVLIICGACSCSNNGNHVYDNLEKQLKYAVRQAENENDGGLVSPRTISDGKLKMVAASDWTSGFFPGILWYMYESSGDDYWKKKAASFTTLLENEKWNDKTHDMGFKMYCSYGNGYRLTHNPEYKEILIQSAKTLSSRFNSKVGCIKSWDSNKWKYPVIIDNMMNLELLFWASKETGNPYYKEIAIKHAQTTIKNHFRDDNSSFHVVDYDPETGEVIQKNTHQGYADGSAWARGQAWGLYGFTMAYRETNIKAFLEQAEKIAGFVINHPNLPDDKIPYWDFDAPGIPNEPRDVSAATIIASALYELSNYSNNGDKYINTADQIMRSLESEKYLAKEGKNSGFLLMHSVSSKPGNSEVDVPIVYSDYYYIESLLRKSKLTVH